MEFDPIWTTAGAACIVAAFKVLPIIMRNRQPAPTEHGKRLTNLEARVNRLEKALDKINEDSVSNDFTYRLELLERANQRRNREKAVGGE